MADATRSKVPSDRLEDAIVKLTTSQLAMNSKIDDLLHRMSQLEANQQPPQTLPSSSAGQTLPSYSLVHRMKLDVPRFDGSNPTGWTFKITQFFEFHSTPDQERLTIASFYMEGPVLAWFQWMHRNAQLSSWSAFLHTLHSCFATTTYEDPTGLLCKLQQRLSVTTYLSEFESLANRIVGLPAPFELSCFISGLSPSIRREVQVLHSISLAQVVSYARLQEEKLFDAHRPSSYRTPAPTAGATTTRSPSTNTTPSLLPTPVRTSTSIPFKRLTPEELVIRREKGLWFHCDEKFSRGHKCMSSLVLLVMEDDESAIDADQLRAPSPTPKLLPESPPAQLSLHALSGHLAPKTLRLKGFINNHPISILIDKGSIHNFLHNRVVLNLGLEPTETTLLRITMGNNKEIHCHQLCTVIKVHIQQHSFTIDFHVLPLCGADVVLGVQWLKTLGPVLTDYGALTMKFIAGGKLIELHRDREKEVEQVSPSQLRRFVHTNPASTFFHIRVEPTSNHTPQPGHSLLEITTLIAKYASLFQPLANLPPSRPIDHTINLLPNSAPVNVRPYRYIFKSKK